MTKRKPETAESLRGIRSQLKAAMNHVSYSGLVCLTLPQARRIHSALGEFERFERVLTEPPEKLP